MEVVPRSLDSPRFLCCPVKMIDKATLQTGTYNIKHIATGKYVALKDTKRTSTVIILQDSHFEHLAVSLHGISSYSTHLTLRQWVLDKLSGLEDTYNVRSFLQNTFARIEQSPTTGAELVSGTESCAWFIRPAGFRDIYL